MWHSGECLVRLRGGNILINSAFGADATPTVDAITGHVHRDVDVLVLYPMNLVATEERFGSWMNSICLL